MSQREGRGNDDGRVRRPETKSFILTSEFWVAAAAAAAVFLGGYALDDIAKTTAWRYGVWIAIAYIISRGIAKAGSQRDYQPEPFADRSRSASRRDDYRDDTNVPSYRDDETYQNDMDRRVRAAHGRP